MYKFFISLLFIAVISTQCKQKNTKAIDNVVNDSTKFFPVNNFIQADIDDVIKTPYFIYKLTEYKPSLKKDSAVISREDFKLLANQFLQKNIATPELKYSYRETVFHDLSTKSFTITYSALNHELPVQNVLILLNDSTNKLNRVFILCSSNKTDSSVTEQFNWKAGKSFQINRSIKRKDGTSLEEHNAVIWNDKPNN